MADNTTQHPEAKPLPGLTVGRDVHFRTASPQLHLFETSAEERPSINLAAKVTSIVDPVAGIVHLAVFTPDGMLEGQMHVPFSETPKPEHWSWMARVP